MGELNIAEIQGAGYAPAFVPRCRDRHVANAYDAKEDWVTKRCSRPDRHRGRHHIITPEGVVIRW